MDQAGVLEPGAIVVQAVPVTREGENLSRQRSLPVVMARTVTLERVHGIPMPACDCKCVDTEQVAKVRCSCQSDAPQNMQSPPKLNQCRKPVHLTTWAARS